MLFLKVYIYSWLTLNELVDLGRLSNKSDILEFHLLHIYAVLKKIVFWRVTMFLCCSFSFSSYSFFHGQIVYHSCTISKTPSFNKNDVEQPPTGQPCLYSEHRSLCFICIAFQFDSGYGAWFIISIFLDPFHSLLIISWWKFQEQLDPFSLVADELSLLANRLRAMVVAEVSDSLFFGFFYEIDIY